MKWYRGSSSAASDVYKRQTLYRPGDVVKIPTFTAFGGVDGVFGVAVVASCNWLGLVQLYFVNRFVEEGEEVGPVHPDDVVEVWWGGDGLFISEIFDVVGSTESYVFDDWPAPVGTLPRGETDGTWLTYFKTRRRNPMAERLDESDDRRRLTLFMALSTAVIPIRMSGWLRWSLDGVVPPPEPEPGSERVERYPIARHYD